MVAPRLAGRAPDPKRSPTLYDGPVDSGARLLAPGRIHWEVATASLGGVSVSSAATKWALKLRER